MDPNAIYMKVLPGTDAERRLLELENECTGNRAKLAALVIATGHDQLVPDAIVVEQYGRCVEIKWRGKRSDVPEGWSCKNTTLGHVKPLRTKANKNIRKAMCRVVAITCATAARALFGEVKLYETGGLRFIRGCGCIRVPSGFFVSFRDEAHLIACGKRPVGLRRVKFSSVARAMEEARG